MVWGAVRIAKNTNISSFIESVSTWNKQNNLKSWSNIHYNHKILIYVEFILCSLDVPKVENYVGTQHEV